MAQIGRYQIIGELGRGAMGVVYHATDPSIGRSVAIKTIRIRDINDTQHRDKLRERLFREARSAGVLSHPNIVTIYDMDEVDGLAYIAMAYVNGPTLEKILSSTEPLSGSRRLPKGRVRPRPGPWRGRRITCRRSRCRGWRWMGGRISFRWP